jgi:hypothetical protein
MIKHECCLLQKISYWKMGVQLQRSVEKCRSEAFQLRISYPSSRRPYISVFQSPSDTAFQQFIYFSCHKLFAIPCSAQNPRCCLDPSATLWTLQLLCLSLNYCI